MPSHNPAATEKHTVPPSVGADSISARTKHLASPPRLLLKHHPPVGASLCAHEKHVSHTPAATVPANNSLQISYTIPLFREKDGTKNAATVSRYAETGECLRTPGLQTPPQALPRFPMSKLLPRQSPTFCRSVCFTKYGCV